MVHSLTQSAILHSGFFLFLFHLSNNIYVQLYCTMALATKKIHIILLIYILLNMREESYLSIVTQCSLRVSSVPEFLTAVDVAAAALCTSTNKNCELWYRGAVRNTFQLIPRISRSVRGFQLNPELETVFLSKFESLAEPYVTSLPASPLQDGINAYWSWLFEMQHYGVPTRLLDWSRDALVGLFFATNPDDTSLTPGIDAEVFVLNPVTLNQAYSFNSFVAPGYIPNVQESSFNVIFGPDAPPLALPLPAAAIGPLNNTRIVAQRGTFTVFPKQKILIPLELFNNSSTFLFKICIAWEAFSTIQAQLTRYGITMITLFPEIQSVAGEVIQEVINESVQPVDP